MTSPIISHAQNFEDVRLWRAFADIENGRYIDIGAQDAVHDSVSLAFYERGWRGIHVEATPTYAQGLRVARPDEVVIQAAVSTQPGPIAFFEIAGTGLSTGISSLANRHNESGWPHSEIWVPTITLAAVFEMAGDEPIHWLKIDVEGMEADVLESWGDHPARPAALVIEATVPNSTVPTHHEWYDLVLSRGYRDVLFDGLSRYFVHETHAARGGALALSPNVFDGFNVTSSHFVSGDIAAERQRAVDDAVRQCAAEREAAVGEARRELEEQLSVTGQQLAEERAAHSAQQDKVLALLREAGQLEGQLTAQTEHHATQVREAEAARQEVLAQMATAADERSAAQRDVAELRVRIEALAGQHALELAKAQATHDAAQERLAAGQAEIERLGVQHAEHKAAWEAERSRLHDAAEQAGHRIEALQAEHRRDAAAWEAERSRLHDAAEQARHRIEALQAEYRRDEAAWEAERSRLHDAAEQARQRIETLQAEHRRNEAASEAERSRLHDAAEQGRQRIEALQADYTRSEAAWEAEKSRVREAAGLAGQQITALQADLDRTLAMVAHNKRLLGLADQLLGEPADALHGWPRKLATMLAGLAGRRPAAAEARHAARVSAWRAETAAGTLVEPHWTESPLAQNAAFAELGFGYKELQMLSAQGPITTVPRLLAPHDAEFIDTAYQAVLGRAPDPEGRAHYLAQLRTGTHKLEILRQLRRSEEGRAFVPGVAGLDRAIKRHHLVNIPIVGIFLAPLVKGERDSSDKIAMRRLEQSVLAAISRTHSSNTLIETKGLVDRIDARIGQVLKVLFEVEARTKDMEHAIARIVARSLALHGEQVEVNSDIELPAKSLPPSGRPQTRSLRVWDLNDQTGAMTVDDVLRRIELDLI